MCGIVGSLGSGDKDLLNKMTQCIYHRGPDDDGFLIDESKKIFMGMRRLSIIDVSGGKQPIYNKNKTVGVVYNGEVYNYQELRTDLEQKGYKFVTKTDTEAIVHGYDEYGEEIFSRLNGMFAIALWDQKKENVYLVRDRLGQKPLYYTKIGNTIYFASELKVFNTVPGFIKEVNHSAFIKYLDQTYIGGEETIYKNVKRIPAGSYLHYRDGAYNIESYWSLPEFKEQKFEFDTALNTLDSLISDAVKIRLMSDVPLGVFLSGGLDSSLVTYYAQLHSKQKINTYTVKFSESSFDESDYAREIAEYLGTNHTEELITPEQTLSIMDDIASLMDEPQGDTSFIPTYWLSKLTRKHVTVALGGDAGDEYFLGYQTFKAWQQWKLLKFQPAFVRNILTSLVSKLPSNSSYFSLDFKLKRALFNFDQDPYNQHFRWFSPFSADELSKLLSPEVKNSLGGYFDYKQSWPSKKYDDALIQSAQLYQQYYLTDDILVKSDRASMAVSLEARAPLIDYRILEFANTLPTHFKFKNGSGKYILKKLGEKYLPGKIVNRPKHGFPAPVADWLRGPLKTQAQSLLSPESVNRLGLLDHDYVEFIWKDFMSGNHYRARQVWTLCVWQLWSQKYL